MRQKNDPEFVQVYPLFKKSALTARRRQRQKRDEEKTFPTLLIYLLGIAGASVGVVFLISAAVVVAMR